MEKYPEMPNPPKVPKPQEGIFPQEQEQLQKTHPEKIESEQDKEKTIENTSYPFFKGTEKYVELPEHRRNVWPESNLVLKGYKRTEIKWEEIRRLENGSETEQTLIDVLRILTRGRVPDNTLYHVYGAWGSMKQPGNEFLWQVLSEEFYDAPKMLRRIHEQMLQDEKKNEITISDFLYKLKKILPDNVAGHSALVEKEARSKHLDKFKDVVYDRDYQFDMALYGMLILHYKEMGVIPESVDEIDKMFNESAIGKSFQDDKIDGASKNIFQERKWIDYKDAAEAVFDYIFSGKGNLLYVAPLSVAGKMETDNGAKFSYWHSPVQKEKISLYFGAGNPFFAIYQQGITKLIETDMDIPASCLPMGQYGHRDDGRLHRWVEVDYSKIDVKPIGFTIAEERDRDDYHPILPVIHGMEKTPRLGWAWAECIYIPTKNGVNILEPDVQKKEGGGKLKPE